MTKEQFRELFLRALDKAADNAQRNLTDPVPRTFLIELHAPGMSDVPVNADAALEKLYLGSDRFYRVIDVAVIKVLPGRTLVFVRVSGHAPGGFSDTWNTDDLGPFKQLSAEHVEDLRVRSG
jgi:hypothetical protein